MNKKILCFFLLTSLASCNIFIESSSTSNGSDLMHDSLSSTLENSSSLIENSSSMSSNDSFSSPSNSNEEIDEEINLLDSISYDDFERYSNEVEGNFGYATNDSIQLTFANLSTTMDYWATQVKYSSLLLQEAISYTFKMNILSTIDRKVCVLVQDFTNGAYGNLVIQDVLEIKANQEFQYIQNYTPTSTTCYIYGLMLGNIDGNVYTNTHTITIKNLAVTYKKTTTPILPPNDQDDVLLTKDIFGTTYHLAFSDEFNGTTLNEEVWSYDLGTGPNGDGWGNNELQYYKKDNATLENGMLKITAKNEIIGGRRYTSSRIKTKDKKYFTYGYFEAKMKTPSFQGSFPAFWLLGNDIDTRPWPYCGEIDIFESINTETKTYSTCHWNANGMNTATAYSHAQYGNSTNISPRDENWHTFATLWTETSIKSYVDDILYYTIDITPSTLDCFHKDFFILLNLAVGSNWAGTSNISLVGEQSMYVDYVRVYQK